MATGVAGAPQPPGAPPPTTDTICSVEKLTEAIKLVENLRSSVQVVFDELAGGKTINDGIKDHRSFNDKERGKKMVANLHINLQNGIHRAINNLEAKMSSLGRYPLTTLVENPNTAAPPREGIVKSIGFHQLSLAADDFQSHKVHEEIQEGYSRAARICENSELLYKSLIRNIKIRNMAELDPASNQLPIYVQRSHIETFVSSINTKFLSGGHYSLKLMIMPSSSGTLLKAIVGRVLKACVVLQGAWVERIIVHSFNEETTNDNIWPPSKFTVFTRLTEVANSASLHFMNASKFFVWLSYYQNLYSQPCTACGKILCDETDKDKFLPPVRRDFNQMDKAYHLSCYNIGDDSF